MKTTSISVLLFSCTIFSLAITAGCARPPREKAQDAPHAMSVEEDETPPPSVRFEPTVATVDPMGYPVLTEGANGLAEFRLAADREMKTVHQATVHMDSGATLILDANSILKAGAAAQLKSGRAWVRVHAEKEWRMDLPGGHILAREAAFNVAVTPEGVLLHHLEGELTAAFGPKPERLRGGTFLLTDKGPQARPTELFTDWTGGLYRPPAASSGYGVLKGRTSGVQGLGTGGTSLILRKQKVSVKIRRRTAITEVEQIFFNPASSQRDGDWRVKLPPGAVILDVALARQNGQWAPGTIKPVIPTPSEYISADGAFFQTGEDEYGMLINALPPAGEIGIRLRYAQKLADVGGRRLYRYPMRGGAKASEFELTLRVMDPDASLRSGWDGNWEKLQFVVRKNDFSPTSDFVAEVFPKTADEPILEIGKTSEKRKPFMLSLPLQHIAKRLPALQRHEDPAMVFLLDFSASMDSSRIQVLKTAFTSLFEKMQGMRVAVFLLRGDVTPIDEAGLAPLDENRRKKFLDVISSINPAGATDLGKAIEQATVLIPGGEGMIVYVGDGKPTRGPMLAAALLSRLAMSSPAPVFTALLLGRPEPYNVLNQLGRVAYVEEVGELGKRLNALLQELEATAFKDLEVNLGPDVARLTPTRIPTAAHADTLTFFGQFTDKIPEKITLSGLYASQHFTVELPVSPLQATDTDVIQKFWAASRLRDLVARGSGREAIVQLAQNAQLVTPYSGMVFLYSGTIPQNTPIPPVVYQEIPQLPEYEHAALRDLPPAAISGLALPDMEPVNSGFNIEDYYRILLQNQERREAVDQCYQRKAVFTPMAGGSVTFELTVDADGRWKKVEQKTATLSDKDILECIRRAISLSSPLPPPPTGQPVTFSHTYTFASSGQVLPQECSPLSRAYIEDRKRAWRQKMPYDGNAYQAESLWKSAKAACELETWTERRAFLEVVLSNMVKMQEKLAFAQLLQSEGSAVAHFIREQILRSIRTPEEARLVVMHLSLHGGNLFAAFLAELERWYEKEGSKLDPAARDKAVLAFARRWQPLDPENAALTLFAMQAAIRAQETDLALHWGTQLLSRQDLTSGQRESLAELFMQLQQPRLAQVAISTSVELAPFDPWTRKRMGDFFRRHALLDDAFAEYDFLAWLLPQAAEPQILKAETLLARGNWELGLQTYEKILQTQNFPVTRHLFAMRLAQLTGRPEIPAVQLRARVRRNGLLDDEGAMLVFVRTLEGHATIVFQRGEAAAPPDKTLEPWESPGFSSTSMGMVLIHQSAARTITLRFEQPQSPGVRFFPPARHQVVVVRNLWKPDMTVTQMEITQRPGFYQHVIIPEKGDLPEPQFFEIPKKPADTQR